MEPQKRWFLGSILICRGVNLPKTLGNRGFTTVTPCLPTDRLKQLQSIHAEVTALAERGNIIDFVRYMAVVENSLYLFGRTWYPLRPLARYCSFDASAYHALKIRSPSKMWLKGLLFIKYINPHRIYQLLANWWFGLGDLGFSGYTITQTTNVPLAETWLKCKN